MAETLHNTQLEAGPEPPLPAQVSPFPKAES